MAPLALYIAAVMTAVLLLQFVGAFSVLWKIDHRNALLEWHSSGNPIACTFVFGILHFGGWFIVLVVFATFGVLALFIWVGEEAILLMVFFLFGTIQVFACSMNF
jgi:hypothetical protein